MVVSVGLESAIAAHQFGHPPVRGVLRESRGDTLAVGLGPVLADLPFALDLGDFDLDADNPFELRGDEALRRVRDLPGRDRAALLPVGQGGHLAQLGFIGYMHEIFNFCDGQRTLREIHRALSHELKPISLETMCDIVCDLDTLGYVTIEW